MLPSAFIPFIPYTERNEQLKIYGDAPCTVSVSIVTCAFPAKVLTDPGVTKFLEKDGSRYVNTFGLSSEIL